MHPSWPEPYRRRADDRSRVSHSLAGRSRPSGDECSHRLVHVVTDPFAGEGFVVATDLSDHHHTVGVRIVVNMERSSMKLSPLTGSPPMPMQVLWPMPSELVCQTAS